MQGWKTQEWKSRHHNAWVENAGVEIAGEGKLWKANILTICCCIFNAPAFSTPAGTPSIQQLQQLLHYVEKQWLKKATIGAVRLSVRDNTARTNNAMESFHASLRRRSSMCSCTRSQQRLGRQRRRHECCRREGGCGTASG